MSEKQTLYAALSKGVLGNTGKSINMRKVWKCLGILKGVIKSVVSSIYTKIMARDHA